MGHRTCILIILLVLLLGMAACSEDGALPDETATMAQTATPMAAAMATKAPPTETTIPAKRDPTATPARTATATPTATVSPTTEPTLTAAPTEVEEIHFQSGHFELVGDLQVPSAEGKHPAIIMVHGDGGIDRYDSGKYRPIMERFLRAGYAVFSWDKPGTGESTGEFVDGAWIITDRASILVDAVEFLKAHPAIDPERIGVWGISQAGAVMPMALTMTDDIAFMIVVSGPGVDSIDQTAYLIGQQLLCQGYSEAEANLAEQSYASVCRATTYQEYREAKESLIQLPDAANLSFVGREIAPEEDWSPWDREVDAFFNPMEAIARTTIPVLALFGEKDTQVDPFQGAQAYEAALQQAGNQHYRVELIPDVNHALALAETGCMNEHRARVYAPEYLDLMEEWLVQLWRPSEATVARVLAQLEGLPIDEFFDESFRQLQLRDPDTLISNGLGAAYGVEENSRFTDSSDRYIRETQQLESAILDLLRSYDRSALSPEQQLSYDIYQWVLDDLVRRQEFIYYNYPINSVGLWDTLTWVINLMVDAQPIASLQEAADESSAEEASAAYVARLSQIDTWVEQLLEGLRLREQAGVIPPRFLVQRSIDQVGLHLGEQGDGSFDAQAVQLYTAFREKLERTDSISAEQRQALLDAALTGIEDTVIPAFLELREYLIHLETIASDVPGVNKLPQGEAYYNYILRHWTGTDLSADQVHELGLAEVARVQAEMRATAAEMGYPADISMAELDQLFSAESDFLQGGALKVEYERLIAQADEAMEGFFDLRPSAEVIVRYDPAAPPAYYQEPPPDGSGPGQMVANLSNSAQFIFYNPPVLVHHETIPGHHVQFALAQELNLPTRFRRDLIFNVYRQTLPFEAYTEGWAFYAEGLAWEMGLYEGDPLNNLGRLRLRLHRTARLVVDTGIHAKGWTVQEAIDYLEEATGAPYNQNRLAQIIAVPGQACGYNIGMLKILELRQRAMDQLGDEFDIKAFHNVILGHGPMPLAILERVVDDWIAAGGAAESVSSNTPVAQPPPGGGGRIAFASMRDGTLDIYVMDADSRNVTRLTNDANHDSGPVWSPDGTRIAFMSERSANHDIYVMDADGSNVTRLTTDPTDEHGAAWSPDGARIAFTSNRSGNLDIYVMDADGSNVTRLTNNPADDTNVAWSPDGAHIAFSSDRDGDLDIYVMDADGSNVTRLTDNPAQEVDPAWSPDGTQVVFVSNRDSSDPASYSSRDNNWEIYTMDVDGSNAIRLTDHPAYDIAPRWSPDGTRIIFVSTRDGEMRIYVMDADGSNQARLTRDSAMEETPAWSP